jgi:hypothetical protein
VVDSREAMLLRGSSSSQSFGVTPHASQIHLNYERMENELRATQDMLTMEREDNRWTRDSWAAYNMQMQALMVVRMKDIFIEFLTFTDMYVC